ncbi:MAG TPA: hypothetical protein VGZ02_08825 [Candidatus Baltobacteraceae bacterium]|jgi:hypothetical protein|nr:hypothetical protein [Candidatus Baltobacteraceae bacterium]
MKLRSIGRRAHLARRPWTERERAIVWRGLTGRMAIAIEPLLGMVFFALLTFGIIWRARVAEPHDLWILSPIFGVAALAFAVYFIAVLFAPVSAYFQTRKPIYQVDGYIRYRGPDGESDLGSSGYVAVLFEDRAVCCEWECYGMKKLPELVAPAMMEFSEYGGIHRIDGKSTGVLPDEPLPLLAIGIAPRK